MTTPHTPDPLAAIRARAEALADVLRIREVHPPKVGKSRCCGEWAQVEPALLITVAERDAILAAFSHLQRDLDAASCAARDAEHISVKAQLDLARAEAALREIGEGVIMLRDARIIARRYFEGEA